MARYIVSVHTPMSADEAFAYMADLRNFAKWDPGVTKADLVEGDAPGPGAAFDVAVRTGPRSMTLRYVTEDFDAPKKVVVKARNSLLTSLDVITVASDDEGAVVTYDAELTLNGPLRFADPLLSRSFDSIGDRAAAGLIRALDGERVTAPDR